jgi:PilZ domain
MNWRAVESGNSATAEHGNLQGVMMSLSAALDFNADPSASAVRVEDHRRTSRRELRLSAIICLPDGSLLNSHTADISRDGIGFFAPHALVVGGDCTLSVPIDACGSAVVLKLVGRVVYCRKQEEEYFRVGMQFIRMDEHTAAIMHSALS